MNSFEWKQVGNTCYQARVGAFLAEVYGTEEGWQFWFAGTAYDRFYETADIAKAACQIYGTHWIVSACGDLGFQVMVAPIT